MNEVDQSEDEKVLVKISKRLYRPLESDIYRADRSKEKEKLKRESKVDFRAGQINSIQRYKTQKSRINYI
ncbi:MAG: hypothetical protein QXP36_11225 [Conexivisphaerales archaeon]